MDKTKPDAFIGVDPGRRAGSVCLLCPSTGETRFFHGFAEPREYVAHIQEWSEEFNIRFAFVELVNASATLSKSSSFGFGSAAERPYTALAVLGIPVAHATPAEWQAELKLRIPKTLKGQPRRKYIKDTVLERVSAFYPNAELYGVKGGHLDGRSDALGIARHCWLKNRIE